VFYTLNKGAQVGLEVSYWDTNCKGPGDADAMCALASFI